MPRATRISDVHHCHAILATVANASIIAGDVVAPMGVGARETVSARPTHIAQLERSAIAEAVVRLLTESKTSNDIERIGHCLTPARAPRPLSDQIRQRHKTVAVESPTPVSCQAQRSPCAATRPPIPLTSHRDVSK